MSTAFAIHPEDIKSALRKRYRSLAAFERAHKLSQRSVTDVLLGRKARPTAEVVARELGHTAETLFPGIYKSADADVSETDTNAHRLNETEKSARLARGAVR